MGPSNPLQKSGSEMAVTTQHMIQRFQSWRTRSLANAFALRAAQIAIASSLMVAMISLLAIYLVERASLADRLHEKSQRVAERLAAAIDIVESSVGDLAKNPIFMTALLDSKGRQTYVEPFLQNYKFPLSGASGLALCDINGELLAAMRSPLSNCRTDSAHFKQVITGKDTARELVRLENGNTAWVSYQGVTFAYTGTIEGVLVAHLDLNSRLHQMPGDLDLDHVALVRSDSGEPLVQVRRNMADTKASKEARAPLFLNKPNFFPIPLEAVVGDHLSDFSAKLRPLVTGYILGSLLLVAVVAFWARRAARFLVIPLSNLTDVAQQITDSGNLSLPVPQIESGEVGRLSRTFAIMVNTLRISEATLEEKVARRTEELRRSETAAEAANRAKSAFLANMSHEIRTPMNGILGMAQMLLMPNLGDAERQDYARTLLTSGQTLLALLNDILDLSKVEAGKLTLESTVIAPAQIVHEIQTLFASATGQKPLKLESGWAGPEGQRYLGDPHRLRQMLGNLVNNALKFTEHGSIRIEAREVERDAGAALIEFSVADTGIGIPEGKLPLLFQPFSQADESTTRHYGGTGLGLSIVGNMAHLMGGRAGVESEDGRGSRFWFQVRLPLVAAHADSRHAPRPAEQELRSSDARLPQPARLLDLGRLLELADEITPLLEQNKFDAFARFKEIQTLVAGTELETSVAEIGLALQEFRYDLALEHLRQLVAHWNNKVNP